MSSIIDFHSHILPGMDDGSKSVGMSVKMLDREAEQGIWKVMATPHFYPWKEHPEQFLTRRDAAAAKLQKTMEMQDHLPEVIMGAEVRYFSGMSHSDWLPALTIGEKNCILIEMPDVPWTDKMLGEVADIYENRGLIPVIAHVDRYVDLFRGSGIPERLAGLPVLVQASASFFLKPGTGWLAMKMLRKQQIHLLGSDCHNLTDRPPNLGPALERIRKKLGDEAVAQIQQYQKLTDNSVNLFIEE